jgi:hypothetical protein
MDTRDPVELFDTRTLIAEAIERESGRTNTINLSEKGRDDPHLLNDVGHSAP